MKESPTGVSPRGDFEEFRRPVPEWYLDAKLGIFIHWGLYAVPAWAEPVGELGTLPSDLWFRHNPYAEWYANTIRHDHSPAAAHHQATFGALRYEQLIDRWRAEAFNADALAAIIQASGARYVVPTAKHHDGLCLWEAPATTGWNTVVSGPRRNLLAEMHTAITARGLRFGVYYSGGLDWHLRPGEPIRDHDHMYASRPTDEAYADYAFGHVADLIDRFRPAILWNDIEWPDAGKSAGPRGLVELFRRFYTSCPDGLVNDRWGETHHDFRTSEYRAHLEREVGVFEHTRSAGYSFGYNSQEHSQHLLTADQLLRQFMDVVSRGGNFLLNIGPKADGTLDAGQARLLHQLGRFNQVNEAAIFGSRTLPTEVARPQEFPWVRWTSTGREAHAFIDSGERTVALDVDPGRVRAPSARSSTGHVSAAVRSGLLMVDLPDRVSPGPVVCTFELDG